MCVRVLRTGWQRRLIARGGGGFAKNTPPRTRFGGGVAKTPPSPLGTAAAAYRCDPVSCARTTEPEAGGGAPIAPVCPSWRAATAARKSYGRGTRRESDARTPCPPQPPLPPSSSCQRRHRRRAGRMRRKIIMKIAWCV